MGKYSEILRRATNSVDYWTQVAIRTFVRDLTDRMDAEDISQAGLAEKIGTSPAYVSKVMRGNANFTLETMTKLAMAVGGKIRVQIVDDSPMTKSIDVQAPKWNLQILVSKRVTRSAVLAVENLGVADAANSWHFGKATGVSDVIPNSEAQAA